jgi:hypothetical protein
MHVGHFIERLGDRRAWFRKRRARLVLRRCRGSFRKSFAIERQDIEGVKLDLVVMFPRVQPVEIGDAVNAEQHRLAIDDKGGLAVAQRGLDN